MRHLLFLALMGALSLSIGCDSSSSSNSDSDGGTTSDAPDGSSDTTDELPACPNTGDKCPAACAYLADCAVAGDACPGFDETARDGIYEGCLESCNALPIQATLVCQHTSCDETISFATGADEGFNCNQEPGPFDGVYQLAEDLG